MKTIYVCPCCRLTWQTKDGWLSHLETMRLILLAAVAKPEVYARDGGKE